MSASIRMQSRVAQSGIRSAAMLSAFTAAARIARAACGHPADPRAGVGSHGRQSEGLGTLLIVRVKKMLASPPGFPQPGLYNGKLIYSANVVFCASDAYRAGAKIKLPFSWRPGLQMGANGGPTMARGAICLVCMGPKTPSGHLKTVTPFVAAFGMGVPGPVSQRDVASLATALRFVARRATGRLGAAQIRMSPARARKYLKSNNYFLWSMGVAQLVARRKKKDVGPMLRLFTQSRPIPGGRAASGGGAVARIGRARVPVLSLRRATWLFRQLADRREVCHGVLDKEFCAYLDTYEAPRKEHVPAVFPNSGRHFTKPGDTPLRHSRLPRGGAER